MTDQIPDAEPTPADATPDGDAGSGWRAWLSKPDAHGRPRGVYLILGAGVLTLIALMLAVYLWSGDRGREDRPICTTIDATQAREAVVTGEVDQVTLVFSSDIQTPEADGWGPVQARLDYEDGRCATLPQGVMNQPALYTILGTVTFYNETTDAAQIEVTYSGLADLDAVLFETPSPEPTPTEVPPTEVPATPAVTPTPSATPTREPATPEATPERTPTETASPTARVRPTPTTTPTPTEAS